MLFIRTLTASAAVRDQSVGATETPLETAVATGATCAQLAQCRRHIPPLQPWCW